MPNPSFGQPHPDVAIVRHVLEQLSPGESVPYETVAKALGLSADSPTVKRRATAARKHLRKNGVVIECGAACYVRLDDAAILDRHSGRERHGLNRKARTAGERLSAIDVATLDENRRREFFAERTINNLVYTATGHTARKKMLAAATISQAEIPMAQALEVLKNGGS